jgi:hypothetical protein
VPLAEPQVPADPVASQAPLPPAAIDGLLRHAQVGSQLIDRHEPVRTARGSHVPGSPVPYRWTLDSVRPVKSAAPGAGHGSLRASATCRVCPARARGRGSQAAASGAALRPSRFPACSVAGGQGGLACRLGAAASSSDFPQRVKSTAHRDAVSIGAVGPDGTGGVAAVRSGRRPRARHGPGTGKHVLSGSASRSGRVPGHAGRAASSPAPRPTGRRTGTLASAADSAGQGHGNAYMRTPVPASAQKSRTTYKVRFPARFFTSGPFRVPDIPRSAFAGSPRMRHRIRELVPHLSAAAIGMAERPASTRVSGGHRQAKAAGTAPLLGGCSLRRVPRNLLSLR